MLSFFLVSNLKMYTPRWRDLPHKGREMTMSIPIFFLIGISFLIVHEMDAIRCKEWSIFPGLSRLNDNTGYLIFTSVHIPLVLLILVGLSNGLIFQPLTRVLLDTFLVIHIFLHAFFHRHPHNQFESRFSRFLILGTGLTGLLDLGLLLL
jgi:hypothetical protein